MLRRKVEINNSIKIKMIIRSRFNKLSKRRYVLRDIKKSIINSSRGNVNIQDLEGKSKNELEFILKHIHFINSSRYGLMFEAII